MRDFINIASAPVEEDCVQVSRDKPYIEDMKAECVRFKKLLLQLHGPEPVGARLAVKFFDHDFGGYYEVVCNFDGGEEATNYALCCEGNLPLTWADEKCNTTDIAHDHEVLTESAGIFGGGETVASLAYVLGMEEEEMEMELQDFGLI